MREFLHAQGLATRPAKSDLQDNSVPARFEDVQLVSLFSGAGGLDQGFFSVGCEPRIAFDSDSAATRTYQANFPGAEVHLVDLAAIQASDVLQRVEDALDPNRPVILLGGPPCQSFSRSNVTNAIGDPRSDLPSTYADLVKTLHKSVPLIAFVFENVPDLRHYRRNRHRYAKLKWAMRQGQFNMSEHMINALNFGVPQNRNRLFLIGISKYRTDNAPFSFSAPEISSTTVQDALSGLPEPTYYRKGLESSELPFHPNHWTMVPRSEKFTRSTENASVKRRSFKRLHWDRPSPAVAYGHREIHVHPDGHRRLSIYEAMLLQGFPKKFCIKGTLSDQVTQISNSVAPPVAAEIASCLVQHLGVGQSMISEIKALPKTGDPI